MLSATKPRPQKTTYPHRRSTLSDRPDVPEETMVIDRRAGVSPAQMVEQKLLIMLERDALPVSQLKMMALRSTRRHC